MKKLYAGFVLIALPLLSIYIIPGTNLTFMAVALLILLGAIALQTFRTHILFLDLAYLPFFVYVVVHTMFTLLVYPDINTGQLLSAAGQYAVYLLLLCFFNRYYFDRTIFIRYLLRTADVTTVYLLLQQFLASFMGIMLGGGIPFLPMKNEGIFTYTEGVRRWGLTYRPRSLFSEPAMYATYTILALAVILCMGNPETKSEIKKKRIRIAIYVLGIITCKSTLGVISLLCTVVFFFFRDRRIIKRKRTWITLTCLLLLSPILGYILLQNSSVQFQLQRLLSEKFFQSEARFSVFLNPAVLDVTSLYKVFLGHDFIRSSFNKEVFLPSFIRQFYCFGIIGLVILIVLLWKLYKRGNIAQKIILVALVVQMFGAEIIHGGAVLLYGAWLISSEKKALTEAPKF